MQEPKYIYVVYELDSDIYPHWEPVYFSLDKNKAINIVNIKRKSSYRSEWKWEEQLLE